MRTNFTIICLITFLLNLSAASGHHTRPDSTVIIKPHWKKGEIRKYEIVQETKVMSSKILIISEVTLSVRNIRKDHIELEWRYDTIKEIDSLPPDIKRPTKNAPVISLTGTTIQYHTDPGGKVTGITNFAELSQRLKPIVDSLIPSFMHSMMPNYFKSFLLKDLLNFHKLYGQQLKIGDTAILNLRDSISPDIDFPVESRKIDLCYKDMKTGILRIGGKLSNLDETKQTSDFIYEFVPLSNWLREYKSVTNIAVSGSIITNEYKIELLPEKTR